MSHSARLVNHMNSSNTNSTPVITHDVSAVINDVYKVTHNSNAPQHLEFTPPRQVFARSGGSNEHNLNLIPAIQFSWGFTFPQYCRPNGKMNQASSMFIGSLVRHYGKMAHVLSEKDVQTEEASITKYNYFTMNGSGSTAPSIGLENEVKHGMSAKFVKRMTVSQSCNPGSIFVMGGFNPEGYNQRALETAFKRAMAHRQAPGEKEKFVLNYFEAHDLFMISTVTQFRKYIHALRNPQSRVIYDTLQSVLVEGVIPVTTQENRQVLINEQTA